MAFSTASVPADELLALTSDAPLCVAANVMDDASSLKWTAGGTESETDITDSQFPASAVRDRFLHLSSASGGAAATTHYFNWSFTTSVAFDTAFVRVGSSTSISSILLTVSDSNNFSTGVTTLFTWGSLSTITSSGGRLVALSLNSNQRITGTGFARLRFNMSSSAASPHLYEVWLGQRRQLSRRPDQGSGYDDGPIGVYRDTNMIRSRLQTSFARARGFQDFSGGFTPNGSDQFGLDDVATIRGIATDTDYLGDPTVVWVDRPNSDPGNAIVGLIDFGSSTGLSMPFDGWAIRKVNYHVAEQPPFALREPGVTT